MSNLLEAAKAIMEHLNCLIRKYPCKDAEKAIDAMVHAIAAADARITMGKRTRHDGDCSIYDSFVHVCTCGYYHELMWQDVKDADGEAENRDWEGESMRALNEYYSAKYATQAPPHKPTPCAPSAQAMKLLERVFGNAQPSEPITNLVANSSKISSSPGAAKPKPWGYSSPSGGLVLGSVKQDWMREGKWFPVYREPPGEGEA